MAHIKEFRIAIDKLLAAVKDTTSEYGPDLTTIGGLLLQIKDPLTGGPKV